TKSSSRMNLGVLQNPTHRLRCETDTGNNFAQHCRKVQALEYSSDHLGTYKEGKKLKHQLFRTLRHIRRSIWQGRVARNKTRELLKIAVSAQQSAGFDLVAWRHPG